MLIPGVPAMQTPRGALEWGLEAGLAFTGFVVQWALTKGLQLEKAGRGLQMMYVQLVFAALFEWAVWGDVMKGWRAVGAVVVLASVAGLQWWKGREKMGDEEEGERR
jgi:drug/metabolite transporter (DMT)-like permease